MSSYLKAELAATCTTLGRFHKGKYLIEPECIESVKDLIRYLKRDSEIHDIRRYLGESRVLQNDLIQIVKSCPEDNGDLFDVTLRLLINLTTPPLLFYGEEIPANKMARNIYLTLTGYAQEYKIAFCDVQFWNKICGKLTGLFETDWTERSADEGIQIERMLMLLRNVVQVPADVEGEKRPANDLSVHDRVLWTLRESQILELLLFVSSNSNEEQYYLNLLEIFSLILRDQNPKVLARCYEERSADEKRRDSEGFVRVRESEKKRPNKYLNTRNFNATFILKGMKSLSNKDVVCHRSLEKATELDVVSSGRKKALRVRKNRIPVESERAERRSAFSIQLFLKEFCLEFLSTGFGHLMSIVKNRLDSGKSLPNDHTYYFWAVKFFLEFAMASDSDMDLIRDLLSTASFHFVQTSMENALERLVGGKKKNVEWIRRIHLILKAYHSLLETLLWMDLSKSPLTRSVSREIKSQIFYVVEYREMTLQLLLRYDPTKFSLSYLRDLIETTHLFVKLLEDYSTQTKMLVQKVTRKRPSGRKAKKEESRAPSGADRWEEIKDEVYDTLCSEGLFPELPPFDAALDIPIDDQKGRAMKRIQRFLWEGRIREGVGLLRSARQVWPENEYFGAESMSAEEETMALQEICLAELGEVEEEGAKGEEAVEEEEEEEEEKETETFEDEIRTEVVEQEFDIMEYKQRLVNKKVVECCGILLRNYRKNSEHTNHCVIKLLHRIGWECCMPALLFQASLLWSLLVIMRDRSRCYEEINTFTLNLVRKFRKHASGNPVVFLELLFWKEHSVALEIQHGYRAYEEKAKAGKHPRKKKSKARKKREEEEIEREVEEIEERGMEGTAQREIDMEEDRAEGEEIEEEIMTNERRKAKKRMALFHEETKGITKKKKRNLEEEREMEDESRRRIEDEKEKESEEDEEIVISKRRKTEKTKVLFDEEEEENKKKKKLKAKRRLEEREKEMEESEEETQSRREIEEEKESNEDEEIVINKRRKTKKRKVLLHEEDEENKKRKNLKAQGRFEEEKEIEKEIEEEIEKDKEIGEESEEDEEVVISKRRKRKKRKALFYEEEEE